jgi:2-polyprenyl-3-methyl-5-hydroxy-6-metoxy-1,4-benzoquinol methylase
MEKTGRIVPPQLYDEEYYLGGNNGFKEYNQGLDGEMHDKFKRVFRYVQIAAGDHVLDLGCGRGELLYYCVKKGAAKALGLDYSEDAIKISKRTIEMLPEDLRPKAQAVACNSEEYEFSDTYDTIFLIEVAEHMNDGQLKKLFAKAKQILKSDGKIFIVTPNDLYESYFQPVKMFLDIPFRFIKYALRIPRGKFKPKSLGEFFKQACKFRIDRGEIHRQMHCNVSNAAYFRKLLSKDFDLNIFTEDHSANPLDLLFKKWFGRHLIVIATPKKS